MRNSAPLFAGAFGRQASANSGASEERKDILRYLERRKFLAARYAGEDVSTEIDLILGWIKKRTARTAAQPGGLGRR